MSTQNTSQREQIPMDCILNGNCIAIMRQLPTESVDFILTDPPYLVNYVDRAGRSVRNDKNADWLLPSVREAYRVLRPDSFMVSFYSWNMADKFLAAWRGAGFTVIGHLVFRKMYASKTRFLRYQHEQAYLLAKGRPALPETPIADVIDMPYSGNTMHPTQKSIAALFPLIRSFSRENSTILDPFCGSGSTLVAAKKMNRRYLGIEIEPQYVAAASKRLAACPMSGPLVPAAQCA